MKVILREDVSHLGEAGEIVKVANGYARNFLLPRNLATVATNNSMKQLEHEKHQIFLRQQKAKRDALKQAEELKKVRITIIRQVKASEEEEEENKKELIYGSVTSRDIAEEFREEGLKISRRLITITQSIDTIGTHDFTVKLHSDVVVPLKVWVVKE